MPFLFIFLFKSILKIQSYIHHHQPLIIFFFIFNSNCVKTLLFYYLDHDVSFELETCSCSMYCGLYSNSFAWRMKSVFEFRKYKNIYCILKTISWVLLSLHEYVFVTCFSMYAQGAHQSFKILNFNDTQFTTHAKSKSKIER